MKRIRVLIVDDHPLVRAGLAGAIGGEADLEVVDQASSAESALEKIAVLKPDVVLMDLRLPGMNGLEATNEIKQRFPDISVVVLTMREEPEYFFAALAHGASGYLLKESEPSEVVAGIRAVSEGHACFSPPMSRLLLQGYRERERGQSLSEREEEVLRLAAQGMTNREMAENLSLSIKTIEKHRSKLMEKLGLQNRTDLLRYALDRGLMEPRVPKD